MKLWNTVKLIFGYTSANFPNVGVGHIQPIPTYHAPSLKKTKRVPADNPDEMDDEYFDKLKRDARDMKDEEEDDSSEDAS